MKKNNQRPNYITFFMLTLNHKIIVLTKFLAESEGSLTNQG